MSYSVYSIANGFIQKHINGELSDLSPVKLQRLIYLANHWHIKVLNTALIDDHFCRWIYGPVVPSLYHKLKAFKSSDINRLISITGIDRNYIPVIDDYNIQELLNAITRKYGKLNSSQLSYITTLPNSAWSIKPSSGSVIVTSEINSDVTIT